MLLVCWGVTIFSPGCDVRTPDESKPCLSYLGISPCRRLQTSAQPFPSQPAFSTGQPHPVRRPDGVRSSQRISGRPGSVSFAGPPARACQPPQATGPSAGGITSRQSPAGSPARYPTRGGEDCLSRPGHSRLQPPEPLGYAAGPPAARGNTNNNRRDLLSQ